LVWSKSRQSRRRVGTAIACSSLTPQRAHVPMVAMRRTSILLLAAGYGLSFVIVCLAACVVAPAAAEHACCDQEDGFRAAARDCCVVTQGVSPAPTHASPAISELFFLPDYVAAFLPPVVSYVGLATLAASPPLVLRV
jgi:hypothetical protein